MNTPVAKYEVTSPSGHRSVLVVNVDDDTQQIVYALRSKLDDAPEDLNDLHPCKSFPTVASEFNSRFSIADAVFQSIKSCQVYTIAAEYFYAHNPLTDHLNRV